MGWPSIVTVSGGFDPLHIGHVRLIQEAAGYGSKLIVIMNNDNWLMKKKGYVFMPEEERAEILKSIKGVSEVVISSHKENPEDMSVCADLETVFKTFKDFEFDLYFCNGGDRGETNTPEQTVCDKYEVTIIYNVGGGKIQSSSELVNKANDCRKILESI